MTDRDLTGYANAEISATMVAFADYLIAEVYGGKLPKGFDEATFRKGVALGGSTRGYFQKSDRYASDSRNYLANVEANRERKAIERADAAKASAEKAVARAEAAKAKAEALVAASAAKLAALAGDATEGEERASEIAASDSEG